MKTNGDDTITAIEANALGHVGLTKREYMAALVAAGKNGRPKEIAEHAVWVADALIEALNKDKGEV